MNKLHKQLYRKFVTVAKQYIVERRKALVDVLNNNISDNVTNYYIEVECPDEYHIVKRFEYSEQVTNSDAILTFNDEKLIAILHNDSATEICLSEIYDESYVQKRFEIYQETSVVKDEKVVRNDKIKYYIEWIKFNLYDIPREIKKLRIYKQSSKKLSYVLKEYNDIYGYIFVNTSNKYYKEYGSVGFQLVKLKTDKDIPDNEMKSITKLLTGLNIFKRKKYKYLWFYKSADESHKLLSYLQNAESSDCLIEEIGDIVVIKYNNLYISCI